MRMGRRGSRARCSVVFALAVMLCCAVLAGTAYADEIVEDASAEVAAVPQVAEGIDAQPSYDNAVFTDVRDVLSPNVSALNSIGDPAEGDDAEAEALAVVGTMPYPVSATARQDAARSMLSMINDLRSSAGSAALVWDVELEKAALQRAAELTVLFSHTRPSGSSCFTAFPSSTAGSRGENIAMGSLDATGAYNAWKNSPGHYANMVNGDFSSVGVAGVLYSGSYYWVQVFAGSPGSGMTTSSDNAEHVYTVQVQDSCVTHVAIEPDTLVFGVHQSANLPTVRVEFKGASALGYRLNGSVGYNSSLFAWRIANASVAGFSDAEHLYGLRKGTTTCSVTSPTSAVVTASFRVTVSPIVRLAGADALETMKAITSNGFADGSCESVVVATMEGYWDALTSSALAGLKGCPILLTDKNDLSVEAAREMARLSVKTVYIAGGEDAVSKQVAQQIGNLPQSYPQLAAGVSVKRLAGADAVGTALKLYEEGRGSWGSTAVVATAYTFQDALSVSPYAYRKGAPVFLANATTRVLDDATVQAIRSGGFTRVVITGGTAAVSSAVESQLNGIEVERLGGATAYETSVEIAKWCLGQGMSVDCMGIATGASYYDALSGSALCGKNNAVLVLVSDDYLYSIDAFVHPNASAITKAFLFGGPAAVSNATYALATNALL